MFNYIYVTKIGIQDYFLLHRHGWKIAFSGDGRITYKKHENKLTSKDKIILSN